VALVRIIHMKNDTVYLFCYQKPALRTRCTKPQPFNFMLEKKRKRETESTSQAPKYKFDTPLGEKILRFTSKPPERFLAKARPAGLFVFLCNTHVMNGLFFRTSLISWHQKSRTILDYNEARNDMVVCNYLYSTPDR